MLIFSNIHIFIMIQLNWPLVVIKGHLSIIFKVVTLCVNGLVLISRLAILTSYVCNYFVSPTYFYPINYIIHLFIRN